MALQCKVKKGRRKCKIPGKGWVDMGEAEGKAVNIKSSAPIKISNSIKKSHGKRC